MLALRILQRVLSADVDDLCPQIFLLPLDVDAISQMYMAVEQIFGVILLNQFQKGGEPPVDKIVGIAHPGGSRVGHHDVHTAGLMELPSQLADAPTHLLLGKLMSAAGVFDTAAEA